jgi:hypothetical protein
VNASIPILSNLVNAWDNCCQKSHQSTMHYNLSNHHSTNSHNIHTKTRDRNSKPHKPHTAHKFQTLHYWSLFSLPFIIPSNTAMFIWRRQRPFSVSAERWSSLPSSSWHEGGCPTATHTEHATSAIRQKKKRRRKKLRNNRR